MSVVRILASRGPPLPWDVRHLGTTPRQSLATRHCQFYNYFVSVKILYVLFIADFIQAVASSSFGSPRIEIIS